MQPIDPNTSGSIFSEVKIIYNLLIDELLFPGHIAHRAQCDSNEVHMSQLISHQLVDQASDRRRMIFDLSAYIDNTIAIDGSDPVDVLGDIDAGIDAHSPLAELTTVSPSAAAVAVLHSDQSQELTSGRGDPALPGDLPDLSGAASLKPIPAKPPGGKPVTKQRHRKALATPHSRAGAA
ncbi:hypothetical protein [Phyllobacterium endophyticum]|uniref:hypothetical protein n=1 Tax=Phyllobacterium endophyticum TaxID=1149773 RepID=UPI00164FEDE4|nr:hypothetical protein [Phyllobacterium endophyticum]